MDGLADGLDEALEPPLEVREALDDVALGVRLEAVDEDPPEGEGSEAGRVVAGAAAVPPPVGEVEEPCERGRDVSDEADESRGRRKEAHKEVASAQREVKRDADGDEQRDEQYRYHRRDPL